jgi:hypothetical protein
VKDQRPSWLRALLWEPIPGSVTTFSAGPGVILRVTIQKSGASLFEFLPAEEAA